jgi:hypothetical protein
MLTPVDRDRLDLEQVFIALIEPVGGGILKLRDGSQQFGFDLHRFVAVRDGPNGTFGEIRVDIALFRPNTVCRKAGCLHSCSNNRRDAPLIPKPQHLRQSPMR